MQPKILAAVKTYLMVDEEITSFDEEIQTHIAASISTLEQRGLNVPPGFDIMDSNVTYSELCSSDIALEGLVRSYVSISVKIIFDPPASSTVASSYEQRKKELEERVSMHVEE